MAEIKVCLYKENSHILKRNKEGDWFLDDKKNTTGDSGKGTGRCS